MLFFAFFMGMKLVFHIERGTWAKKRGGNVGAEYIMEGGEFMIYTSHVIFFG
jgi:hypothetical protein